MNGFYPTFPISCVTGKECEFNMNNTDFINLLYEHLEKRSYNNFYDNAQQDAEYIKASMLEQELNNQYDNLNLSDDHRQVISHWIDAIHAQEASFTAVVFRMGVQCCFTLLLELADLKQ